jgi:Haem-binding uptake, Tiki superfamily, ChaN
MSFKSVAAKGAVLRIIGVMTVAAAALVSLSVSSEPMPRAQSPQRAAPPKVRLPDEAAGIDGIVGALISVYDQFDVVALGESHERKVESDLRVALIRHPDFAKKVRTIVVEFASTTEQATLDRYIRGENVPRAQFERVWKRTSQFGDLVSQNPFYTDLFTAAREVNSRLPADARIRVFGGDPGPGDGNRDAVAVSVLKEQVFQKRGKALVIYGAGHFYRALPKPMLSRSGGGTAGIVRTLEMEHPGRTFTMIPVGGRREPPPWTVKPDYQKLDRALKTQVRPVMVPLQRLPFRDFTAEEFLGGDICTVGPRGCTSAFKGSTLTLGQMADAAFYYVGGR